MTRPVHHPRGHLRTLRGEDGYTLLVAVAIASVCLMLGSTVVALAIRSNSASGQDRDRRQAASAAESAVDRVTVQLSALSGTSTSAQWCAAAGLDPVALTTTSTYSAVTTFWRSRADMSSPGLALPCSQAKTDGRYARVVGTGLARTGSGTEQKQVAQAVLELATSSAPLPQPSVFAGALGSTGTYATIGAASEGPALLVGRGGWTCQERGVVTGDVTVSDGQVRLGNYCRVAGTLRAEDGVVLGTQAGADKTVTAGSAPGEAWGPVALPTVTGDAERWRSLGFSQAAVPWTGACQVPTYGALTLPYTQPTIVDMRGRCSGGFTARERAVISVNTDVVLLVEGFRTEQYVTLASNGSHKLWIIDPTEAGSACGSANHMTLGERTAMDEDLQGFLYSPCDLTIGPYVTWRGRIWADQLTWGNRFALLPSDIEVPLPQSSGGVSAVLSRAAIGSSAG